MNDKCKHTRVKFITVSHYIINIGWRALQEKDDIDMQNYYIEQDLDKVICEDCAETLNE